MTLRHDTQCNIAKQGSLHTRLEVARKQLVLLTIEQLVAIAKGWPQMKLVTTKTMSSLLHMFLMTQRSGKIFSQH